MPARLVVTRAGKPFADVDLGEVTIIGREPGVDLLLPSDGVSRHHARLTHTEDGWLLEDLWSRNGTFVNRRRVRRKPLADGDRIEICDFTLTFHCAEEAPAGRQPEATMILEEAPPPRATATSRPVESDGIVAAPAEREELERLRARLRAIYQLTDALDITLGLGDFLEKALAKLLDIFPQADRGFVMLKAEEGEDLVPKVAQERGGEPFQSVRGIDPPILVLFRLQARSGFGEVGDVVCDGDSQLLKGAVAGKADGVVARLKDEVVFDRDVFNRNIFQAGGIVAAGEVCEELAKAIPADGEGASHLITIDVSGCPTRQAARQIAKTVAESALVKTAVTGADPNWGRIVSAAGKAVSCRSVRPFSGHVSSDAMKRVTNRPCESCQ